MMRKILDRLLILHFRDAPADSRLDRLEQDVWRRIRAESEETALPWGEKIFLAFGEPQFRMASLAAAIILGAALSPAFSPRNAADASGMEMFTMRTPYLVANLIEDKK